MKELLECLIGAFIFVLLLAGIIVAIICFYAWSFSPLGYIDVMDATRFLIIITVVLGVWVYFDEYQ